MKAEAWTLGQKQDYTALWVSEWMERVMDERDPVTYDFRRETLYGVRHLERVKLRTPYPSSSV